MLPALYSTSSGGGAAPIRNKGRPETPRQLTGHVYMPRSPSSTRSSFLAIIRTYYYYTTPPVTPVAGGAAAAAAAAAGLAGVGGRHNTQRKAAAGETIPRYTTPTNKQL